MAVAVAVLSLSACTSNDADAGDVAEALTDVDIPQDQADCIGNGFEDEFDQDQLNDLAAADDPEDYPEGRGTSGNPIDETVTSIIERCTSEGQSGSGSDGSGGESDSPSETTTTTEAGSN